MGSDGIISTVNNMCKAMEDLRNESYAEGLEEGRNEGVDLMAKLIKLLLDANRFDDAKKVSDDPAYRQKLLNEFQLV